MRGAKPGPDNPRYLDGRTRDPAYHPYCAMKERCSSPATFGFDRYGGRGIRVCGRWLRGEDGLTGFQCFLQDIGPRPSALHTLERKDNDGHYEPGNVRWATRKEQGQNRHNNIIVNLDGDKLTLSEAARRAGLSGHELGFLWKRIRRGVAFDVALEQVRKRRRRPSRIVEFRGEKMSLAAAARAAGIKYDIVRRRLLRGWSLDRALLETKRINRFR